jgi:hypothetical protein
MCEFESCSWKGVLDTTLCYKVCQWLATGRWFSPGTPISSNNKTCPHDITEILLKVALNTINQTLQQNSYILCKWPIKMENMNPCSEYRWNICCLILSNTHSIKTWIDIHCVNCQSRNKTTTVYYKKTKCWKQWYKVRS